MCIFYFDALNHNFLHKIVRLEMFAVSGLLCDYGNILFPMIFYLLFFVGIEIYEMNLLLPTSL